MSPASHPRPIATVTLEPTARRTDNPRPHAIKVMLRLGGNGNHHGDKTYVAIVARRVLLSAHGTPDERSFCEVLEANRSRKGGGVVVGVEGAATFPGRPVDDTVESVRDALVAEGYRVTLRQRRECAELGCKADTIVDWEQAEVPRGWYSSGICGAHNYRTCARCRSKYALSSTNSVGPAPSVHCEVCGLVIIEWGSSKIWRAELITRARSWSPRKSEAAGSRGRR